MMKHMLRFACILLLSIFFMCGCSNDSNDKQSKGQEKPSAVDNNTITPAVRDETDIDEINNTNNTESDTREIDTDENDSAGSDTRETDQDEGEAAPIDPGFVLYIEAEEATIAGKVRVENSKQGYTGEGYLVGIEGSEDTVAFAVTVPADGAYDLNFISASYSGYKENNVLIDGDTIGVIKVEGSEFTDSILEMVYLTAGEHEIKMTKSWGWIYLDALKVTPSAPADKTIYEVSSELIDPKATDSTKRLMQYLTDAYGEYVISGQYGDRGIEGSEFTAIYQATGKYPAILGLDFIEYTPSRVAHGTSGKDVEYAIRFNEEGGIVTFCWHWNAPEPYLYDTSEQPWWSGFYTRATDINLKKIMDGEDEQGYELLLRDIDAIAIQLKKLQEADVPVLWRPLHEASGGWFWWGASGAEAYIELYQLLYDRLTNYHELHNLIWVWNGQNEDWYPGDAYVDIVGTDIYPGERVYSAQVSKFNELVDWNGENKKIVALTENGCLFDPEYAFRDNAKWAYFGTWEGEFVTFNGSFTLSEKYTEIDMVIKVYNHEKVITLDELPDLKTYGNIDASN